MRTWEKVFHWNTESGTHFKCGASIYVNPLQISDRPPRLKGIVIHFAK